MESVSTDIGGGKNRVEQMEAIVAEFETGLLRYAERVLSNHVAAQDVVQNVFIKLFKAWHEGTHPTEKLKGWLYRVTHNEAIDYMRRESRLKVLHEKQAEDAASSCPDGKHCPVSDDERRDMVMGLLKKLHPREQQIILLRMDQGLSYTEISQITGRTEGNVGNILHHAVQKLSESLKKTGVAMR